jgi:galactokinase
MVVIERLGDLYSTDLHLSEAEIDFLLQETFLKDNYTLGEIAYMLGASEDFVCRKYLSAFSPEEARTLDRLKLRSRSRHVLSEGRRVRQAAEALRVSEMNEFGKLMYESHESCATDYEVSIPELDALVAIARESGALGSRLTGAGFGGCTISLVENALVEGFVRLLERSHSRGGDRTEKGNLTFDDRIFVAKPMPAAMVLR